uniref:Inositol-pentakisphosphate 2-kinase n=1 Tax=Sinocyclocheilus grahami TaxID=75366 RepID=A0A672K3V2_SINGR
SRNRLQIDGPYNESFMDTVKNCPTEDDGSVEYAVGKVHQYRVAMTVCFCSLKSPPRFTYSISILDLDPKPYEGIPHQYKLDTKIVNYYLRSTQAPPPSSLYKESEEQTKNLHKSYELHLLLWSLMYGKSDV